MERIILHADLNNFYASVECLYHPQIRNQPVAVVGDAQLRHGIVLAKNEEAKRYRVQTGDTLLAARQKCQNIVFMPAHYERYLRYSRLAREIYGEYTDQVESFGLDECWLDVTKSTHLFGDGVQIAKQIRERIKSELGVTASIGVSFNKIFAKLGSDLKKPDATTQITSGNFKQVLWPLPVKALLCVGGATNRKLQSYGIATIGDLANADVHFLEERLGKGGKTLFLFANGQDHSTVRTVEERAIVKSIGNSTTAPRDLTSDDDVKITLYALCECVAERLREQALRCNVVQVWLRDNTLFSLERQAKLVRATCTAQDLFQAAFALYRQHHNGKPLRSMGVRASQLCSTDQVQLSLLPDIARQQQQEILENAIDEIRKRFGHNAIARGIMFTDMALSRVNPNQEHVIHPVGFYRD